MKSKILVFLQFFIIFLMTLPLGNEVKNLPIASLILIVGTIIGILAVTSHKRGNFNIRPDIKENCLLVTDGIYAYIRHPMYLSVLSMMLGIALLYASLYEAILYVLLFIVLVIKMLYEESLWVYHSSEYEVYKKRSKRLLPFIF